MHFEVLAQDFFVRTRRATRLQRSIRKYVTAAIEECNEVIAEKKLAKVRIFEVIWSSD